MDEKRKHIVCAYCGTAGHTANVCEARRLDALEKALELVAV